MKKILLFLFTFSIFITTWATSGLALKQTTTPTEEKILSDAKRAGYKLITPEEIKKEYLNDPSSLFLVDNRQEWEYESHHIKDAVVLPAEPTWWYQHSPKARKEMREVLGPDNDRRTIFY